MNKLKTKEKTTLSNKEKNAIDLSLGKRKPVTERDKKLVKEMEAIKKNGRMVYIPHD